MKRRPVIAATAALVALAAGAGTALWRRRGGESDPAAAAPADIWALTFQDVAGKPLAMAQWRERPLIVNFWATWCAPCVVEMPLLDAFARTRKASGWRVLALAIDQAESVRRFVEDKKIGLDVALAGAAGLDLARSLGNAHGVLPFTVVFASDGTLVQRKTGAVTPALLDEWSRTIR